jgi:hypothetical protein
MDENATRELEKSLQALATCLETPVIPGEMPEWLGMVVKGVETVEPLLRRNIESVHKSEYEQIVHEDRGLGHRVEALRNGDTESLELLDRLKDCLEKVKAKAAHKEPDELALNDDVGLCEKLGLEFVIHAQKQEIARRTWLSESINRMRGGGD